MPARIIDGKAIAEAWRTRLTARVRELRARGLHPCLAAITVVGDAAWGVYVRNQAKACDAVGITHRHVELPPDAAQSDLDERIESLNLDPAVHGIIVQSPLKPPFSELQAQAMLSPDKDVEAVGPANLGLVLAGRHTLAPCTAVAAVTLAQEALPDLRGVDAVVIGASAVVGKPIAQLLIAAGATVTNCHIHTKDLRRHCLAADLLVVAVGKPGLITRAHVKPGAVVVDVGINRVVGKDGKSEIVGDVAAEVAEIASALTPVPGGVGALTTMVLLDATVSASERLADSRPTLEGDAIGRVLGAELDLPPAIADRLAMLLSRHLIHTPSGPVARSAFEGRLSRGALVLDGAMGSELMARGVAAAEIAQANLAHPDLVQEVHRAYVAAGADAITANTFGANRWRLHGDRELAVRLAGAGVRLAREVARAATPRPFVLASIGPLGVGIGADVNRAQAEDAFAEVALAMADAGADGFAVETMGSTEEAVAALAGVRRVSRLPVLVSRSFDRDDAAELGEFARACEAGGATAVGINCAAGPRAVAPVVARLASLTRLPVLARPNAGFPTRSASAPVYHLRPEYLVEQARSYLASGVGIIGGCCGVGPAHITALAAALSGKPVAARGTPAAITADAAPTPRAAHPLIVAARSGAFPVMAFVPGRLSPGASGGALHRLAEAGAGAIGLLSGWPGTQRARLPARLRHLQDLTARPAVLELLAEDLTLPAAQEMLLTAHLLGVRLVLIDSGVFGGETRADLVAGGCDPLDLLALTARLNAGRDLAGTRLEEATAFTVGVRVAASELERMERFCAQGADFLTLQPVYEPARFRDLMARATVSAPLFAEVLLLPDAATADELDNELPSLSVPERLKRRLAEDPEEDARGVLRFLRHWRHRLAGVCLLLPDERTAAAERVLAALARPEEHR